MKTGHCTDCDNYGPLISGLCFRCRRLEELEQAARDDLSEREQENQS